jgi:hypothetical protein
VRSFAQLLRFAFAVGALLAPLASYALAPEPGTERPERAELTAPEAPSLELAPLARTLEVALAAVLPRAGAPAPPPAPRLEQPRSAARSSPDEQLRWSVAHGTTSSLH